MRLLFTLALFGCGRLGFDGATSDGAIAGDDARDAPPIGGPRGVGTGLDYSCALRPDATVWCWGDDHDGQLGDGDTTQAPKPIPQPVPGVTGATILASGPYHACAIGPAGGVTCWGGNTNGEVGVAPGVQRSPVSVAGLPAAATALATGGEHTCAVTGGDVWCWGSNSDGQLGIAGGASFVPQLSFTNAVDVVAGDHYTCARRADQSVWCWGRNANGQLGDGTTTSRSTPMPITGLAATAIAGGENFACAITPDAHYRCWGYNSAGQLGDGTETQRTSPVAASALDGVTAIACGQSHSCAVRAGNVLCWGSGSQGELGDGAYTQSDTPVVALADGSAVAIAAGDRHACAQRGDASVACWGGGGAGQLGDGRLATPLPHAVTLPGPPVAVETSQFFTCAIAGAANEVFCWGNDNDNQLGDLAQVPRAMPFATGVTDVVELALGDNHVCARKTGGDVWCWGDNDDGELGRAPSPMGPPAQIVGLGALKLAAGTDFTCAITKNGTAACWGSDSLGQLGDGGGASRSTPTDVALGFSPTMIAAGTAHVCAGSATASGVRCWGGGADGQLGNGSKPSTSTPVIVTGTTTGTWTAKQIAAGSNHTCATDTTDKVRCWGNNAEGQIGDNTYMDRPSPTTITVAGGPVVNNVHANGGAITCAATTAGPYCWGENFYGALGDGSVLYRATPVAVIGLATDAVPHPGNTHTCAISAGTLYCWGDNNFGQLGDPAFTSASRPITVTFP